MICKPKTAGDWVGTRVSDKPQKWCIMVHGALFASSLAKVVFSCILYIGTLSLWVPCRVREKVATLPCTVIRGNLKDTWGTGNMKSRDIKILLIYSLLFLTTSACVNFESDQTKLTNKQKNSTLRKLLFNC